MQNFIDSNKTFDFIPEVIAIWKLLPKVGISNAHSLLYGSPFACYIRKVHLEQTHGLFCKGNSNTGDTILKTSGLHSFFSSNNTAADTE